MAGHPFVVELQNDMLEEMVRNQADGGLKDVYFEQREYKHPATPWQFVCDMADILVGGDARNFSASFHARAQMHVSKAPESDGWCMYQVTAYYELYDAKNKKSGTPPPEKNHPNDVQYIKNELRPFYPKSNVDIYYRWKEELKFKILVDLNFRSFPSVKSRCFSGCSQIRTTSAI
jgi:hypothetical protein